MSVLDKSCSSPVPGQVCTSTQLQSYLSDANIGNDNFSFWDVEQSPRRHEKNSFLHIPRHHTNIQAFPTAGFDSAMPIPNNYRRSRSAAYHGHTVALLPFSPPVVSPLVTTPDHVLPAQLPNATRLEFNSDSIYGIQTQVTASSLVSSDEERIVGPSISWQSSILGPDGHRSVNNSMHSSRWQDANTVVRSGTSIDITRSMLASEASQPPLNLNYIQPGTTDKQNHLIQPAVVEDSNVASVICEENASTALASFVGEPVAKDKIETEGRYWIESSNIIRLGVPLDDISTSHKAKGKERSEQKIIEDKSRKLLQTSWEDLTDSLPKSCKKKGIKWTHRKILACATTLCRNYEKLEEENALLRRKCQDLEARLTCRPRSAGPQAPSGVNAWTYNPVTSNRQSSSNAA